MSLSFIVRKSALGPLANELSPTRLRAMMKRVLGELGEGESVTFVLTDDDEVHALNRDYRGYDKPTDVLAFAMREGDFEAHRGDMLGDVIVSVATAARQAKRAKKTLEEEVLMLLVHGLLHLLGWDHDTKPKDVAMRRETARLMQIARNAPPPKPTANRARAKSAAAKSRPTRASSRN